MDQSQPLKEWTGTLVQTTADYGSLIMPIVWGTVGIFVITFILVLINLLRGSEGFIDSLFVSFKPSLIVSLVGALVISTISFLSLAIIFDEGRGKVTYNDVAKEMGYLTSDKGDKWIIAEDTDVEYVDFINDDLSSIECRVLPMGVTGVRQASFLSNDGDVHLRVTCEK